MRRDNDVLFEAATLGFLNFSGEEQRFNAKGDRNFVIFLDEETAELMERAGWNVKRPKPREGDEEQVRNPYLPVAVRFENAPPQIYMITSNNRTLLDETTVGILDNVDIENVDLYISPYDWEVNGETGRKAYLRKMFVTIYEDELDRKYNI